MFASKESLDGKSRNCFWNSTKGARLADAGHVKKLWTRFESHGVWGIRATCRASMRQAVYALVVLFDHRNFVHDAYCTCRAGWAVVLRWFSPMTCARV
jgi:hypothetical protein